MPKRKVTLTLEPRTLRELARMADDLRQSRSAVIDDLVLEAREAMREVEERNKEVLS